MSEPLTDAEIEQIRLEADRHRKAQAGDTLRLVADVRAARTELAQLREDNEMWKATNQNLSALVNRREARVDDLGAERDLARDELAAARAENMELNAGDAWLRDQNNDLKERALPPRSLSLPGRRCPLRQKSGPLPCRFLRIPGDRRRAVLDGAERPFRCSDHCVR